MCKPESNRYFSTSIRSGAVAGVVLFHCQRSNLSRSVTEVSENFPSFDLLECFLCAHSENFLNIEAILVAY
jgi:hypothetical protein